MSARVIRVYEAPELEQLDAELHEVSRRPSKPLPFLRERRDDPFEMLLSFHGEIRRSLDLLDDLARSPEFDQEAGAVAYTLWEFFTGPLLWHDEDEEVSVLKRLRVTHLSAMFEALLSVASQNHREMEGRLTDLTPHLEVVMKGQRPDAGALAEAALGLRELLEPHLALEEREIYPFARYFFSDDTRRQIMNEIVGRMRARGEEI
jgi:hemerythrin-like domain-containing protein